MHSNPVLQGAWRFSLIVLGAALTAFNINTFVRAGELFPAGFVGVSLLLQEVFSRFFGIEIPYSVLLIALNIVPAAICFRVVGKKFTLLSIIMVVLSGLMTDFMPELFVDFTLDPLLSAVFGGILHAVAVILCLHAGATAGGTDFIAIAVSEKFNKDSWNYIFLGNCALLILAGALFSLDRALYSIIFQFAMTAALNTLYKGYQQRTMLIVTSRPREVYDLIHAKTGHGATAITGAGLYGGAERTVLYSVVSANEVTPLIRAIRALDPDAFINAIKTEQINGKFYRKPKD